MGAGPDHGPAPYSFGDPMTATTSTCLGRCLAPEPCPRRCLYAAPAGVVAAPAGDVFAAARAAAAHARSSQAAPAPARQTTTRPGGADVTPERLAALRARIDRTRSQATRDRLEARAARWAQILGAQA